MHLTDSDLRKFFDPQSIALVGVSRSGWRFGGLSFLRKFTQAGYRGRLYPINPKADEILGIKAWPDLQSLPEVPDLAMVALAAERVPGVVEACKRIGIRHIHILTAGFAELGTEAGIGLERRLAEAAEASDLKIIGPNCMGPYRPASGLTAWGAIPGLPGPLGIISQSGGMTQRLTEYAASLGLGVEKAVSVGNGAVLDAVDFLEAFGRDEAVGVIGLYLESIGDGAGLLTTARRVSQRKPVVLLKGGKTDAGARTAASHTGALAGNHMLWEAAARQANLVRVDTMDEWADGLIALNFVGKPASNGLFVIGGGGGSSVVYGDVCIREGLTIPALSEHTMTRLRCVTPEAGSIAGNPLDSWLTFSDPAYLANIVELADQEPSVSIILVDRLIARNAFHMPEAPDPTPETISELSKKGASKPVVFVVDSEGGDPELASRGAAIRATFGKAGYAAFPTISRAARALSKVCDYYHRRDKSQA